MKNLLIQVLFLCFALPNAYGQEKGIVHQDTTKAYQLYEKAKYLHNRDTQKLIQLHQSIDLFTADEVTYGGIIAQGHLAYLYAMNKDTLVHQAVEQAMLWAQEKYQTDKHSSLYYTYLAYVEYYWISDKEKSVAYAEKILEIVEKPSVGYFQIIKYMSNVMPAISKVERLEALIKESEQYTKKEEWKENEVVVQYANFFLNYFQNNYEQAIIYGKRVELLFKDNEIFSQAWMPDMHSKMAMAYKQMENYDEAVACLNKIEMNGPVLANIAKIYYAKGDMEKTIENYEKSIVLLNEDRKNNAPTISIIYMNMGIAYKSIDDLDNAERCYKESMKLPHIPYANVLLGTVLSKQEKHEEALTCIHKGIVDFYPDFHSLNVRDNPKKHKFNSQQNLIGNTFYYKANTLWKLGKRDKNLAYLKQAKATAFTAIEVYSLYLKRSRGFSNTRMAYNWRTERVYQLIGDIGHEIYQLTGELQDLESAFQIAERKKIATLLDVIGNSAIPKEVAQKEKQLANEIRRCEQVVSLQAPDSDSLAYFENELFLASQTFEAFLENLAQEQPNVYANFYKNEYAKTTDIQQLLDDQTLFLEYSATVDGYTIHAIDQSTQRLVAIKGKEQLNKELETFHRLLQNRLLQQTAKRTKFIKLSNSLYEQLLAPIAPMLAGKQRIMIVPEKQLYYLPFEVLLPTAELRGFEELDYLVKQYEINYHYSGTAFKQLQGKPAILDGSLLGFAPVFEEGLAVVGATRGLNIVTDSLYRGIDKEHFVPLVHTESEVKEIASLLKERATQKVLLKSDATEAKLHQALAMQPYQFVHIATHGIVNYKNPKLSALACYQNRLDEDGLYFANEIQMQDIQADLIILSSCESGIGQLVSGEGLIALNRSFIYAGARNVLFSLWKVNDLYTKDLMVDFYKTYSEGNTTYTSALRQAKLKMLSNPNTAQPRFWAPFVLMGQ